MAKSPVERMLREDPDNYYRSVSKALKYVLKKIKERENKMYCFDETLERDVSTQPHNAHLGHGYGPVPEGLPQFNKDMVDAVGNRGEGKE